MDLLHFDKGTFILLALVLLTLPINWLLGWGIAVLVHEACHIAVIRILKGNILGVHIGIWGVRIEMDTMSAQREILCALAGPAGSLLLLCFLRVFPSMAVCAGFHALFNLLPVYPLDGGRMLRGLLTLRFQHGALIAGCIENITICIVATILILQHTGALGIILAGILIIKKISLQTKTTRGTIVLHHEIAKKR